MSKYSLMQTPGDACVRNSQGPTALVPERCGNWRLSLEATAGLGVQDETPRVLAA